MESENLGRVGRSELIAMVRRLQAPGVVLVEAERLLREVGVFEVRYLDGGEVEVARHKSEVTTYHRFATLAEAYAALRKGGGLGKQLKL